MDQVVASRRDGSGAGKALDIVPGAPAGANEGASSASHARRSAVDPPVRDPTAYAFTDHFLDRVTQPGRYVTFDAVREAIVHGQLRWSTTDGWRFAYTDDGVRYVIVVEDTETPSPVVVTGWTEIVDPEAARTARRFDATDVETIELRSALSARSEERIPDEIRPREVDRPFTVGNHRVRTDIGDGYVVCADCNGRFRSKATLTTRHCR
ncbi:hypothetical protein SAMN05192561_1025 [Halopenitus malekzadehii]|uniref:Uncharacterized protein n=1 Tax=Halopenitus malekzadehii TaxID=1267564 RepID=A0A1H6IDR6_9EURY|nr:hypothetical protein SAMN05192561_1025 [Halopenitus malekzadehii]